jgi:selenocysteine lyase/cysteine desulfurase
MTPAQFRALFPATATYTWLDSPGSPPAARPVAEALRAAHDDWLAGDFDWLAWDAVPEQVRRQFAEFLGVSATDVALMGSVAEAAATVAATLPAGRVVLADEEFRSNLFPWTQLDPVTHQVIRVPSRDGAIRTEDLVAACTGGTVLLAVSEVLSGNGVRADLPALRAATDRVGARLFVDASQSLGALHVDMSVVRPDYLAVHGYKWMLCPRGAAWLAVRPDRQGELRPLSPSWKSTPAPHAYFGGTFQPSAGAARCDTSPAWLSWLGAAAALRLHLDLDPVRTERHCTSLAASFLAGAEELGLNRVVTGEPSQIAVVALPEPTVTAQRLRQRRVRATILGDRLRVGFHYFNDEGDVQRALAALRP